MFMFEDDSHENPLIKVIVGKKLACCLALLSTVSEYLST